MTEQERKFIDTYNSLTPEQKTLAQACLDDIAGNGIKPYHSLTTAAGLLGVTYRTALEYIRTGKLKAHKAAGKWIVYADDVRAFLDGK